MRSCLLWRLVFGMSLIAKFPARCDNPDHLEPIEPYEYDSLGYDQFVFRTLIGSEEPELWMIEKPDFARECAIVLRREDKKNPKDSVYRIEFVQARERLLKCSKVDSGEWECRLRKNPGVDRYSTKIPRHLAADIIKTWAAVIRKTRYADHFSGGIDGATYEFYARYKYYGKTWSPMTGVPRLMVDCGGLLVAYVRGNDDDRSDIEYELVELLRKIREENIKSQ